MANINIKNNNYQVGSGSGSGQVQSSYHSTRSSTVQQAKPFSVLRRPDKGRKFSDKSVRLLANHFKVKFDSKATITEYVLDVEVEKPDKDIRSLKTRRWHVAEQFREDGFAYDGKKSIFCSERTRRTEEEFTVRVGNDLIFNIKEVQQLELQRLDDYFSGRFSGNIRPVLQGMDVVMRENPARSLIQVGRNFYKRDSTNKYLGRGKKEHTGFKQSLKPTSNGLVLCLDYSAVAFYDEIPVFGFLALTVKGFAAENDVIRLRTQVEKELRGLKVRETLSEVKRKYTIAGLSPLPTWEQTFMKKIEGKGQEETNVLEHLEAKYGKIFSNLDLPCLNLGSTRYPIYIPINFCKLAEGQPCGLKLQTVFPRVRKSKILDAVRDTLVSSSDRAVTGDLKIKVDNMMTKVDGRVICPPKLKLSNNRNPSEVSVNIEKGYWNYHGNNFVEGVKVESWGLIYFGTQESNSSFDADTFISDLRGRSKNLGMRMEYPIVCKNVFPSYEIKNALEGIVRDKSQLQILICIIPGEDYTCYSQLKWISETKMGVMTQCCRFDKYLLCERKNTYLDNLCMKINQKVGGKNVELFESLPDFQDEASVMLVGADVNHPAANDKTGESIAAVVGTVNWPAANRYIARIEKQTGRQEEIKNFGEMCKDLIVTFSEFNKKRKPDRIVVFRDGVGEGQFDMVLKEELVGLKRAISDDNYNPKVTVIVGQKRHHTRIFLQNGKEKENISPGTVVDTVIVHPFEFDFYLCSHYGNLGTSKPTHYHVLHDENEFTSDDLQQFIYHLCFTFARCTKPVSLVPPILYADLAASRGRVFYDASKKADNAGDDSDPYKLHEGFKNEMFFV